MRSSRIAIGVGLLSLTAAALVFSFAPGEQAPETSQATTSLAPGEAAMRATLDPETGTLTTGHGSVGKADGDLHESLSRSSEGLVEVHHPDGSVSVNLEGRFQNASMARLDANGKLQTTCVSTHAEAEAFCSGHSSAPVLEEK